MARRMPVQAILLLLGTMLLVVVDRDSYARGNILPERYRGHHSRHLRRQQNFADIENDEDPWIARNVTANASGTHPDPAYDLLMSCRERMNKSGLPCEMEVEEVQNTSICSYKIAPVLDETGNWMLKNLNHIVCNKVGNKCHQVDRRHCCIQTYKIIDLKFARNAMQQVKLYTGCVCAYASMPRLDASVKDIYN